MKDYKEIFKLINTILIVNMWIIDLMCMFVAKPIEILLTNIICLVGINIFAFFTYWLTD